jgi:hypothetical protein
MRCGDSISVKISIDNQVNSSAAQIIEQGLAEHTATAGIETRHCSPLVILLQNEKNQMMGGLIGTTVWDWLQVKELWVGTKLLQCAEDETRVRQCHHALLDTFDFQALEFYRNRAYEVFGLLSDFPRGHKRYFLSKSLTGDIPKF